MMLIDTSVTVNGTNGTGVQLTNSGTITMIGGGIETTGTGGQAIFASGAGKNHGTFIGTSVQSNHGTGILAQGSAESEVAMVKPTVLEPAASHCQREAAPNGSGCRRRHSLKYRQEMD